MNRRQMFAMLAAPVVGGRIEKLPPLEFDIPQEPNAPQRIEIAIIGKELIERLVDELKRGGHASQMLRTTIIGV